MPVGLEDAEAVPIGSLWRTTHPASVVVAVRYGAKATLALLATKASQDRYTLETGTRLRLLATYEPSRDPTAGNLDQTLYYGFYAGRGYRRYEILDGPCAGQVVDLPAGDGPYWMPPSALAAHATLERIAEGPR